ncbi:MAG: tRNA (adenosine(37)-N6)-threonylcarbamoyltransferase complex dimerization subunit type 1 TsaB [Lysobacterales bacterium]|jgi:tRNA threonylcarbamoyladenosine biosynthesis protein TsaB
MKRLLAIETSAETCSVALEFDGDVRESFEHAPMKHAELILPAVNALLDAAGVRMPDLDAIAFGRGPGSFTSLRIGIGVVQGLAWGADIPVVPVSSLAAVAQGVLDGIDNDSRILVAMDARMGEVFHGEFVKGSGATVVAAGDEGVCAPGDLSMAGAWIAAGNGFERFEALEGLARDALACRSDAWPRASAVLQLAHAWLLENEALPAGMAQPVYIRNNVAERPARA